MPKIDDTPVIDRVASTSSLLNLDRPDETGPSYRPERPRPVLVVDNGEAVRTGRHPDHATRQIAAAGTPLQVEFNAGRIPSDLAETADAFGWLYEASFPGSARSGASVPGKLSPMEYQARAAQICALVKYRCGPLYEPLVAATAHAMTMRSIGGGGRDDAPLGRLRVHYALLFAQKALHDLARWESTGGKRNAIAGAFPAKWLRAANDDLRREDLAA